MTDREAAAGLVARLKKPAPPFGMEEFDPTYDVRQEAARAITTLLSELERVAKERDSWKTTAEMNATSGSFTFRKLEAAEARALKAEKERDEAVSYNWTLAENVKVADDYALTARALVAEAVRLAVTCESALCGFLGSQTASSYSDGLDAVTAAHAFIDRAKEVGNG